MTDTREGLATDQDERLDAPPRREEAADRRDHIAGDRGISPVGGRLNSTQGKILGVCGMVAVGGIILALSWKRPDDGHQAKAAAQPARQVVSYDQVATTPPPLPPAPTMGGPVDPAAAGAGQIVPAPSAGSAGGPGAGAASTPRVSLAEASRRAPLMAFSQGGGAGQLISGLAAPFTGAGTAGGETAPRTPTELDNLRRSSSVGRARATALPDRNYLILAGTQIPCVLQTALDSSTPGYTTCIIPRDVFSDNGRVVLLDKGTRVLGEYRGGMQRGQRRLFVLWTRAVTPRGIAIDLASPASDALGRGGFAGELDNRFWERFGGALLLSLVDDGVYVAAQGAGRDLSNTVRVPSDVAGIALQGSINLPPILRKNQGEDVGIMVAQDFDFADVYGVKAR